MSDIQIANCLAMLVQGASIKLTASSVGVSEWAVVDLIGKSRRT